LEVITGHYETLWGASVAALRKCPDKMRFSVQSGENAQLLIFLSDSFPCAFPDDGYIAVNTEHLYEELLEIGTPVLAVAVGDL